MSFDVVGFDSFKDLWDEVFWGFEVLSSDYTFEYCVDFGVGGVVVDDTRAIDELQGFRIKCEKSGKKCKKGRFMTKKAVSN